MNTDDRQMTLEGLVIDNANGVATIRCIFQGALAGDIEVSNGGNFWRLGDKFPITLGARR